jgi:hypothetical protein
MCVICYEFADENHWSDRMLCDENADEPPTRARYRRTRLLNAVLAPYGLTVSDPGVGRHTVVSDQKGASEVASGLPAVWQAAHRLSQRQIDVLDPHLLDVLAGSATKDKRL